MHQIDFAVLNGEQFEELCEDLFKAMGFDDPIPQRSGRGPDGGRDLIVIEKRESGVLGAPRRFKWLVECKNFAKSGKSVTPDALGSITDKLVTHGADGYLLVTSTVPSINVETTIKSIDESERFNFEATYWARNRLIDEILKHRYVLKKYFQTSETESRTSSHWSKRNPFLELFPYEDSQSSYFFGRQTEVTEVVERIYQQNFILLYGESGVGKTSLTQAGILPILRSEGTIAVVSKVDGSINLANLLNSIKSFLPESVKCNFVGNNKDDSFLKNLICVAEKLRKQDLRLTIFFDQFETIFQETQPSTKQVGRLFSEIATHVKRPGNITIVFSLRADYLDAFGVWTTENKISELWQNSYPIQKLSKEQAVNVLNSVPEHVSAKFSDDLVDLIVSDLQKLDRGRIYPPNLQIVASKIFDQARGANTLEKEILEIGLESYEEIGGTAGVLESFLSDKLDELGADQENAHIFLLSLVRATGVRTAVSVEHLSKSLAIPLKKVRKLIKLLIDARLIKTTDAPDTYELVHDVIAEKVLEVTDDTQRKIKSVIEALQISVQTWQNERLFESRNKLDMFYQYHSHLELELNELKFLILSENESEPMYSFREDMRNRYFRWLESNPALLNIRLLEEFLEAYKNGEISGSLLESLFVCYCRIPDLEVQKELVSLLEKIANDNLRAIYTKAYQTSLIPNTSTMSYLQELVVDNQFTLTLRTPTSYRILNHYNDEFVKSKNKVPREKFDAIFPLKLLIFPLKLLSSQEFQERMFEMEAYKNEERSGALLESLFLCYCRIPDLEVQKELVSLLEKIVNDNLRAIYTKAYQTSLIPNTSTMSYLQELVVDNQFTLTLRTPTSYRILNHYNDEFVKSKNKVPQEKFDAIFPLKLLGSQEFQERMFEFAKLDNQNHARNAYKAELISLLYDVSPERCVDTLWELVKFTHHRISTYKEFLKLLRIYKPDATIDKVVYSLREYRKDYHWMTPEVELLVNMDSEKADTLFIEDLHDYRLRFPYGSKQYKDKLSKNYRGSLLIILQAISRRQLDTATTYLEEIIVKYEPEKLKHGCFDSLCSIQTYIPNPDIFIFLLEDRFAKIRQRASRYILETIDHDETLVTKLSESIMNQQELGHKLQPTRHDALRSKIQTLCKLRLSDQSSTQSRIDVLTHLENNDRDSQIKELASDSLKQL